MSQPSAHAAPSDSKGSKTLWQRLKKPLTVLFFLLLIVLFTLLARRIDWSEVFSTLADFKVRTLIIAAGLTLASFLVYACFDLIGRTYIRQDLGWRQILPVGIISYAFNLNLSAWVGGIAMRYRLYSRLGVSTGNIAKILGLSLATTVALGGCGSFPDHLDPDDALLHEAMQGTGSPLRPPRPSALSVRALGAHRMRCQ